MKWPHSANVRIFWSRPAKGAVISELLVGINLVLCLHAMKKMCNVLNGSLSVMLQSSVQNCKMIKQQQNKLWGYTISRDFSLNEFRKDILYLRNVVPEAGIKGKDKWLHPTVSVGCNYLSLLLICASGTTFSIGNSSQVMGQFSLTQGSINQPQRMWAYVVYNGFFIAVLNLVQWLMCQFKMWSAKLPLLTEHFMLP